MKIKGNTIETERLILLPMQANDFYALHEIFTDPNVMACFDCDPFTHAQMEHWLKRNLDHQIEFWYGLFSIIRKSDGKLIGDCVLEQMEVDGIRAAELGYDFRSDIWNQGFATEAASAVRDFAFRVLSLPQLISLIRVGNTASQCVAEKIGMKNAGTFKRYGIQYYRYAIENSSEKKGSMV
jgi:ribosomal-protein-alanine N-acetyltransferase